jgi:hypothetical protein
MENAEGGRASMLEGAKHMAKLQRLGTDRITDYEVFLLGITSLDNMPENLQLPSKRFVCLLAMDARGLGVNLISALAEKLLNAGCVYFCCWGPDCERVHDIVDDVIVDKGVTPISWGHVMTTWHSNDSLQEAVEFFLWLAAPNTTHAAHCASALALRVGNDFDVVELELEVVNHLNNPPTNPPLRRSAAQRQQS